MCNGGLWESFVDGPCRHVDAGNQCDEEREALGCICRIVGRVICVNGQGLNCSGGSGRWENAPPACIDGGDSDGATNIDVASGK